FLTAEVFKAQAAKGYQLVHEVVATEQLDEQVQAIVEQILTTGPQASIAAKQLVADIVQAPEDLSERTSQLIADLRVSEEGQNGLKAFFDKQPAPWIKSNKE
ncbi:enoyl-CoA hydratase-related protein, partial [Oleiphilus sp. HI0043]|uniref:enoyl-CoA hydratase-related protein n=5 Tax=Oleiphilus TaxID=141450 RepID=UPI000A919B35